MRRIGRGPFVILWPIRLLQGFNHFLKSHTNFSNAGSKAGTEKLGGPPMRRSSPWISIFETREEGKGNPGDCIFMMAWPGSVCVCPTGKKQLDTRSESTMKLHSERHACPRQEMGKVRAVPFRLTHWPDQEHWQTLLGRRIVGS